MRIDTRGNVIIGYHTALVLLVLVLVMATVAVARSATVAPLVLTGRLVATEEDVDAGTFTLESEEPVTISVASGSYLHDVLQGTVGHEIRLTLQPDPR